MLEFALTGIAAFLGAAILTAVVRKAALRHGRLDIPNQRSSHRVPVPRGGGLAIVAISLAGVLVGACVGAIDAALTTALCGSGLIVATAGFIDDRSSLPAAVRLASHAVAAVWAVVALGGLPPLQIGPRVVDLHLTGDIVAAVGIVWAINLSNFMDGIDGIAASQAFFVALAGGVLAWLSTREVGFSVASIGIAAASLGFLLWNWQPAKIFMGDVGSGYLGLALGVLALAYARNNPGGVFVWSILGAAFIADATVTLFRRLARRERVFEAHRIHAYQWLSRRWRSHQRVTTAFLMVNMLYLLPLAGYANVYPAKAAGIALSALASLMVLAGLLGSGRPESKTVGATGD